VTALRDRLEDAEDGVRTGLWAALVSVAALAAAGIVGLGLKQPWLFPSLGPTLMVLAETPRQPAAHWRNVLSGHVVGIAAGYLALIVTGLTSAPPVIQQGLTGPRVVAACLSVGLTAFVLQAIRTPHPPAGATTLIVSLGLLKTPASFRTMVFSVALCTVIAVALNLAAGVRQLGVRADP
jgi:CBS-domain-containing membrane protein